MKNNCFGNFISEYISQIIMNRYLTYYVHGSITHNSQKVKTAQVFIDTRTDKQNGVQTYNELLFNNPERKEILTGSSIDNSLRHYGK